MTLPTRWQVRLPARSGPVDLLAALLRHLREVAPHGPRPLRAIAISLRVTLTEAHRGLCELEETGEARRVRDTDGNAIGWEIC